MIWALLAIAAVAVGYRVATFRSWVRAAERLGLHFAESSFWGDWEIYGELRGCKVHVRNVHRPWTRRGRITRLTVYPPRRIATELEVAPETILTHATKRLTGQDAQFGDEAFDGKVEVRGREEVIYAVLDARARPTVQRFVTTWRGRVTGGEVHRDAPRGIQWGKSIEPLVLDAVRVAELLQAPEAGYAQALLHNLAHDPSATVRRKCLEILLKMGGEVAERALRVAVVDSDPELLLAAAVAAEGRGSPLLAQLAASVRIPGSVAERALLRLAEVDAEQAVEVTRQLAGDSPRGATARALELAGHFALDDLAPRLALYSRHPDPALATAAAQGLAGLSPTVAEPALRPMLGHPAAEARVAAAEALGAVGTLGAVALLLGAADGGQIPRKTAREAVQRIQGRHARAAAGTLALAEDEGGGLALAGEPGRLSVAPRTVRVPEPEG